MHTEAGEVTTAVTPRMSDLSVQVSLYQGVQLVHGGTGSQAGLDMN